MSRNRLSDEEAAYNYATCVSQGQRKNVRSMTIFTPIGIVKGYLLRNQIQLAYEINTEYVVVSCFGLNWKGVSIHPTKHQRRIHSNGAVTSHGIEAMKYNRRINGCY